MYWLPSLVLALSLNSQEPAVTGKPEVTHVGMAAPDVVVLTIQAQSIEYGKQVPYEPRPGDEIEAQNQHRYIKRDGNLIGALVGSEGRIMLAPDRVLGDPLDTGAADQAGAYRISSNGDAGDVIPQAVFRKSKPLNVTRAPAAQAFGMEHSIMLKTAAPLQVGKRYTVRFKQGMLAEDEKAFVFDPARLRSEAVHVNQIGFRPDDPAKMAFLSFWMGTGRNLEYPAGKAFHVLDDKTGEAVFSGKTRLSRRVGDKGNKTLADIFELDFSAFHKPGVYRVSVEGVGCSYPFEIGPDVWKKAFVKSMRGLYCQHSGIELGPPDTTFVRPRGFHPADGVKVYVSEGQRAATTGGQTMNRFQALLANKTDQVLPNAWGGYMDAGDWDRRTEHALMPLLMFDLAEMFPETFAQWNFEIPASKDDLPDLVNEALWEVDFLRRMQQKDGSIFGAIESGEHPKRGEGSWQESLPVMAYARTPQVAYNYTSDAARAALWFQTHKNSERAQGYRDSALKAFEWAEKQQTSSSVGNATDARCLAAAELYRLTGGEKWQEIFLAATRFKSADAPFFNSRPGLVSDPQSLAAWTYLRTDHPGVNKAIQQNIRHALLRDADRDVGYCEATDFHWAGGPQRTITWGALSVPESSTLVRAHFITGDDQYLRAIVLSALSGAGANPVNMCYTTGVGSRWPQHPLHEDARVSNQSLFEGVTIGGPIEAATAPQNNNWYKNRQSVEPLLYPPVKEWPPTESYFDVFTYVPMNEFTVHQTMLPTSFVWGYLAAREQAK